MSANAGFGGGGVVHLGWECVVSETFNHIALQTVTMNAKINLDCFAIGEINRVDTVYHAYPNVCTFALDTTKKKKKLA